MTNAPRSPSPLTTAAPTPAPLDPRDITEPEQIAAQLALLTGREADLTLALNALISDRSQVDGALLHLRELTGEIDALSREVDGVTLPRQIRSPTPGTPTPRRDVRGSSPYPAGVSSRGLGIQNVDENVLLDDAEGLVPRVNKVWETSERVGGKVRKLDDEIGRVREAADVVTEVLELKVEYQFDVADSRTLCRRSQVPLRSRTGKLQHELVEERCRCEMLSRKEGLPGP